MEKAHRHSYRNRETVQKSVSCGCFCCCEIYPADAVVEYVREDEVALCPQCGVDAVLGDASGFPLTLGFLEVMKTEWFTLPHG